MENKLKEWSLHLLDLGKRNRLLNDRPEGLRTIQTFCADWEDFFLKLTSGTEFSIFPTDEILQKFYHASGQEEKDIATLAKEILKPTEVLCYKKEQSMKKVLKNIFREFRNALSEKGIHPLYMAFGFIEYPDGEETAKAPLLLVPISLKITQGQYRIVLYDDEVITNPTFSYWLKSMFRVELLPYGEGGFFSYLDSVYHQLEPLGMNVLAEGSLGIYSFLKMNMYEDVTEHRHLLLKNANILRLCGTQTETIEENLPIYPVVDADSSQLSAIRQACKGTSFVLQGPPGSGKSQTITNMISSFIANGKKVLFVSEKQAALNIVYENLKRADLDSFVLELYSHKANKKEFINELYRTAHLPKYDIKESVDQIELDYEFSKDRLDEYRQVLHRNIDSISMSLYEVIQRYFSIGRPFPFSLEGGELTLEKLLENQKILDEYEAHCQDGLWKCEDSEYFGFCQTDPEFLHFEAPKKLEELLHLIKTQNRMRKELNQTLHLNLNSYRDMIDVWDGLEKLIQLNFYQKEYFRKEQRRKFQQKLKRYLECQKQNDHTTVFHFLKEEMLPILSEKDIEDFRCQIDHFRKYFSAGYRRLKRRWKPYLKIKMADRDLLTKLEEAFILRKIRLEIEQLRQELPQGYRLYEYELMLKDTEYMDVFSEDLNLTEEQFYLAKEVATRFLIYYSKTDGSLLNQAVKWFDVNVLNLTADSLDLVERKLNAMIQSTYSLNSYAELLNLTEKLKSNHLYGFVLTALEQKQNRLSELYESCFWENIMISAIKRSPILQMSDFESLLKSFQKADVLHLKANKAMIVSKLSRYRPDDTITAGTEFASLVKEYHKNRSQKPIRTLLEELKEFILEIKPVFLMSPLSVSTYLSSTLDLFDVVIFDEASQVYMWDALGAIYRAKQLIVIGDSKQMPPSNFFSGNVLSEEEEEDETSSVLEQAMTCFDIRELHFHYRSRNEELIAFSNRKFYQNHLITTPQAKVKEERCGIDFYHIDGIYDAMSRTNRQEAEFVVGLIEDHIRHCPNRSLGVVAFSNAQANRIEELLEEKIKTSEGLNRWISQEKDEPFFIKNLESVQGDERDSIIFSVCYGYNKDHKFYQHFGPLNNIGGERRLNVAITRAKYHIMVVSSITAGDFHLESTDSVGVRLLKEYLEYAANIKADLLQDHPCEEGLPAVLKKWLTEEGYSVHSSVGTSAFKVDLALLNEQHDAYQVALMSDGKTYQIGNVSDANRLQEMMLSRLGWKVIRLFSVDFAKDFEKAKRQLLKKIREISEEISKSTPAVEPISLLKEEEVHREEMFLPYEEYTQEEIERLYLKKSHSALIKKIVEREQPISVEYLLKKICFIYGRTKVTKGVRSLFETDLKKTGLTLKDGFLSTHPLETQPLRISSTRKIEEISHLELEDGICKMVRKNNGMTKEGCFKAIVSVLGYLRMSENAVQILERALVYLKLRGEVFEKDGCLYV